MAVTHFGPDELTDHESVDATFRRDRWATRRPSYHGLYSSIERVSIARTSLDIRQYMGDRRWECLYRQSKLSHVSSLLHPSSARMNQH